MCVERAHERVTQPHTKRLERTGARRWQPARLALVGLLLGSGCAQEERVTTNTVLARSNCKQIIEPIKLVTLAEAATYRGSELLQMAPAAELTPPLNSTAPPTATADDDLPLFVALSRGRQPTRGYELHLSNQALVLEDKRLRIPVHWSEPDPSVSHPLVDTHPCLVVSVPRRAWQSIEAVDQHGTSLGTLNLSASE